MNKPVEVKNFNARLSSTLKSAVSLRDNIQGLLIFALVHFREHGDTSYLTKIMNGTIGVKSIPTATIKDYIKNHAPVVWKENKKKDGLLFKKTGECSDTVIPNKPWYEFSQQHQAKKDMDVLAQARSLLKRITTSLEAETVKNVEEAKTIRDTLRSIVLKQSKKAADIPATTEV